MNGTLILIGIAVCIAATITGLFFLRRENRSLEGLLVLVLVTAGVAILVLGGMLVFASINFSWGVLWFVRLILGVFMVLYSAIFFIAGIKTISEEDRAPVERMGKFTRIAGPGMIWICPFIEAVRDGMRVDTREQSVPLFVEGSLEIDFKGGGTAKLVNPDVWVRPIGARERDRMLLQESVGKMVYAVDDWIDAVRDRVETALRSFLNNLTSEDALVLVAVNQGWWEMLRAKFPELVAEFANWGLVVTKITIQDFDWSKEVKAARELVLDAERKVEKAKRDREAAVVNAESAATLVAGQMVEMTRAFVVSGYPQDLAREAAERLLTTLALSKDGSFLLTSTGGSGLGGPIVEIAAMLKRLRAPAAATTVSGAPVAP